MLALLAAQLLLVVSHDAAARGQLRPLEKYAEQTRLAVSLGNGNAISDSAVEALMRWPALVTVEIVPPLTPRDAALLRRIKRLAARLPPVVVGQNEPSFISLQRAQLEEPSLALLGPALLRVERAPSSRLVTGPCPETDVRTIGGEVSELQIEGAVTQCVLDWLHARFDLHPEAPGNFPLGYGQDVKPPRRR